MLASSACFAGSMPPRRLNSTRKKVPPSTEETNSSQQTGQDSRPRTKASADMRSTRIRSERPRLSLIRKLTTRSGKGPNLELSRASQSAWDISTKCQVLPSWTLT